MSHSQILGTWNISISYDFVPWIGEKLFIGLEFQQFSRNNKFVRVPVKMSYVHLNVLLFSDPGDNICFLVRVRDRFVHWFLRNFRTFVPGTLECISDSFPGTLTYLLFLLELYYNVYFFSNPVNKVMISAEISCNHDLRVWRIHLALWNVKEWLCLSFLIC